MELHEDDAVCVCGASYWNTSTDPWTCNECGKQGQFDSDCIPGGDIEAVTAFIPCGQHKIIDLAELGTPHIIQHPSMSPNVITVIPADMQQFVSVGEASSTIEFNPDFMTRRSLITAQQLIEQVTGWIKAAAYDITKWGYRDQLDDYAVQMWYSDDRDSVFADVVFHHTVCSEPCEDYVCEVDVGACVNEQATHKAVSDGVIAYRAKAEADKQQRQIEAQIIRELEERQKLRELQDKYPEYP